MSFSEKTTEEIIEAIYDITGERAEDARQSGGGVRLPGVLIHFDEQDPNNRGWAYQVVEDTGAIDDLVDLRRVLGLSREK
jgi:hypothetical protein